MFNLIQRISEERQNNQKVEISFKKNKVKIKVDGQLVYLKAGLTMEEKNKFYLAKYQDNFIKLILENKNANNLRNKIDDYIKNINTDTHIIKSILDKLYLTKEIFYDREREIEGQVNNFIKEVKQTVSNSDNTNFHLDAFISNNILSDVYGTTTMEGGKINLREIKEKKSNNKLIKKEADNIYKAFTIILQESPFL